jgi:hypothetical protein
MPVPLQSGCEVEMTPPNGWGKTRCAATVVASGLCAYHLRQRRDDVLLRQRISTVCLVDRLCEEVDL